MKNMTILGHFSAVNDPGFRRTVDPDAARQQLHMSFGLVILLAAAIAGLALSFHFEPQTLVAGMNAPVKLVVQVPQRIEVQQASRKSAELPGG